MTENPSQPDPVINELGLGADAPAARTRGRITAELSSKFVVEASRLMKDLRCEDVIAYDVRDKSDLTDYIIIGSGTSDRQMRSVADDLQKLAAEYQLEAFGKQIDGPTTWVVIDFVDLVVHLFEPQARLFYDLEMLWGDCPKVDWKR